MRRSDPHPSLNPLVDFHFFSEHSLSTLLENVYEGVWEINEKRETLYITQRTAEILGYNKSELIGKKLDVFLGEASRTAFAKHWLHLSHGSSERIELRFHHANGAAIETITAVQPSYQAGKLQGAILLITDITQIKRSQQQQQFLSTLTKQLFKSFDPQVTLQKLVESLVPDLADWCAIDLLQKDGNVQLYALAHKDPQQVKWARQLREKEPVDMTAKQGLPNVLKTGKSEIYPEITQEMILAAARDEKHLRLLQRIGFRSVMIVPLVGRKEVLGAITLVTTSDSNQHYDINDLTFAEEVASRVSIALENAQLYNEAQREIQERKEAEEELKKSESRFQRLLDSSIIGVLIATFQGEIHEANDAFLDMLGYTRQDLENGKLSWKKMTPEEHRPKDKFAIQELKAYGECTPYEKEYIRADGTRLPILIGIAMLDLSEGTTVAFILDISERKKLEQRKDEFISIASHELKTPLTSIKGMAQIIQKHSEKTNDQKLHSYLTKMNSQLDRLKHLVGSLLDVSVIQTGKMEYQPELLDLNALVKEAVESIQLTTETHQIILNGECSQKVIGDQYRLTQVLINLLTNAIKYSPDAKKVCVDIRDEKKRVVVSVQDFGIGIPKEHQREVFNRFFRSPKMSTYVFGLGLGLFISAEIIKRHHGKIGVRSEEGKGSTFFFSLPAVEVV